MPFLKVLGFQLTMLSADELFMYRRFFLVIDLIFFSYVIAALRHCLPRPDCGVSCFASIAGVLAVSIPVCLVFDFVITQTSKRGNIHDRAGARKGLDTMVNIRAMLLFLNIFCLIYDLCLEAAPPLMACSAAVRPESDGIGWPWLPLVGEKNQGGADGDEDDMFTYHVPDIPGEEGEVKVDRDVAFDMVVHEVRFQRQARLVFNGGLVVLLSSLITGIALLLMCCSILWIPMILEPVLENPRREYRFRTLLSKRIIKEEEENRSPQEQGLLRHLLPRRYRIIRGLLSLYGISHKNISRVLRGLTMLDLKCSAVLTKSPEFGGALPHGYLEKGKKLHLARDFDDLLFSLTIFNYVWIAYGYQGLKSDQTMWEKFKGWVKAKCAKRSGKPSSREIGEEGEVVRGGVLMAADEYE
eukprot:g8707.t1